MRSEDEFPGRIEFEVERDRLGDVDDGSVASSNDVLMAADQAVVRLLESVKDLKAELLLFVRVVRGNNEILSVDLLPPARQFLFARTVWPRRRRRAPNRV